MPCFFLINFPRGDIEGFGVSIEISSQFVRATNSYPPLPIPQNGVASKLFSSINGMKKVLCVQDTPKVHVQGMLAFNFLLIVLHTISFLFSRHDTKSHTQFNVNLNNTNSQVQTED